MKADQSRIPSIAFFSAYRALGGVQILFVRLAEFISMTMGIKVYLIDYVDGYMPRTVRKDAGVEVIPFTDGRPVDVPADTILIFQGMMPYHRIRSELRIHAATRLVFWTLHPFDFVPFYCWKAFGYLQCRSERIHKFTLNTYLLPLKRKHQEFLRLCIEKKSIFFMDGSTHKTTCSRLDLKIPDPIFVPIPATPAPRKRIRARNDPEGVAFAWIGRLCEFKAPILGHTMIRLAEYAERRRTHVKFFVVGGGSDETALREMIVENKYFKVSFAGTIVGEKLDNFLCERVDVLAAMGASALEGARLGLPTILLDAAYGRVDGDYLFRWLFQSNLYGLGDIMDASHFEEGNDSLDRIMDSILHEYEEMSNRCHEYFLANHSLDKTAEEFLKCLGGVQLRYGDIPPHLLSKGKAMKAFETTRDFVRKNNETISKWLHGRSPREA